MSRRDISIRMALVADAKALTECMRAAYLPYTSRLGDKSLPPMEADYKDEINLYPVWVIELDGALVGAIILMLEDKFMTIANLAVHPKFQGHGLGRHLLEFAEIEARRQGYEELRLATHVLLPENISLYLHLGWSEVGRDESRVYMRKHI